MLTLLLQRILGKPWPEVMQACQLGVEHLLSPRTGAGCSGYISEQDRSTSHGAYTPRTFLFESCKFSVVVLNHVGLGALSELWSRSRNMYVYIAICPSMDSRLNT